MSSVSDANSLQVFKLLFKYGSAKTWYTSFTISHFWIEKIVVLVQFAQLFALCYSANYGNWPLRWRGYVEDSKVSWAAGDVGTYFYDDILADSEIRYVYASGWVLICGSMLGIYLVFGLLLSRSVIWRVKFQKIYFFVAHLLYLPIALGILPVALCSYSDCWESSWQVVASVVCLVVASLFLLGIPGYLLAHAVRFSMTPDPEEHEGFLQLREMEYVLGVSHNWLLDKLFLFSSFRKSYWRVYHQGLYQLFVCALALVHSVIQEDYENKMLVFLIMLLGGSLYITAFPVYRCMSSSVLYMAAGWILTTNCLVGYVKAIGLKSQMLVDSNMKDLMLALNICGVLILLMFVFVFAMFRLSWPVNVKTVRQLATGYRYFLADLRNSQKMILVLRSLTSYQFVHPDKIAQMIGILDEHYKLLYKENHPLQYTVLEQLDSLYYFKRIVAVQSLLPSRALEDNYQLLVSVVNRKWNEKICMNPKKKHLLLVFTVLAMFLNNRRTQPFRRLTEDNKLKSNESESEITNMEIIGTPIEANEVSHGDELAAYESALQEAYAAEDTSWLINLTERGLEMNYPHLDKLRQLWDRVGLDQLHGDLKEKLFYLSP